jgi:hypothetical protein
MASGDGHFYNKFLQETMAATWNLNTSPFKVMLVTGYSPDLLWHTNITHVRSHEVSGPGYTAGGQTLAGHTTEAALVAGNPFYWIADHPVWSGLDVGTPSHAIIYYDGGSDPTRHLMMVFELGVASSGGSYEIQWDENDEDQRIFEMQEVAPA